MLGAYASLWRKEVVNAQEYYHCVIDRLKNCYQFGHYVIAAGNELSAEARDPVFPAIAEPVNQLGKLTLQRGLQVHLLCVLFGLLSACIRKIRKNMENIPDWTRNILYFHKNSVLHDKFKKS